VNERIFLEETGSWVLDQLDQKYGGNGKYEPRYTGKDVDVYVVDSGINANAIDKVLRGGKNFVLTDNYTYSEDCNTHGTRMASVIGASNSYGVAPGVRFYSLREDGNPQSQIFESKDTVCA
jgi:subtilisin family serine protease